MRSGRLAACLFGIVLANIAAVAFSPSTPAPVSAKAPGRQEVQPPPKPPDVPQGPPAPPAPPVLPQPGPKVPAAPLPIPTANDFLALALEDAKTIHPELLCETRWITVPDGEEESAQAIDWVLGHISRGSTAQPAPRVVLRDKDGKPIGRLKLLRICARTYAPTDRDLKEWLYETFEELVFDPAFSKLVTKDTARFSGLDITQATNYLEYATVGVDVLRFNSPHLRPELIEALQELTGSSVPVVDGDYFLTRATTTVQDSGVYKTIFGGLYYSFSGIKRGFKKGTDLDNLLEQLGIGNIAQGVTAKVLFDRLRSDKRAITSHSLVTGSERDVTILPALSGDVENTVNFVAITGDVKRQSIDIGQRPLPNIFGFKADAKEVIWTLRNGLHGFALFNGADVLQDQVPDDVASDFTIPPPWKRVLQPMISCTTCHEENGGWQPVRNDAKTLLTAGRVKIVADINFPGYSFADLQDRINGLFKGDFELKLFPRARADYAAATLRATGPWDEGKKDVQATVSRLAAKKLFANYARWNFKTVTPEAALAEIGVRVDFSKAAKPDDARERNAIAAKSFLDRVLTQPGQAGILEIVDPRLEQLGAGIDLTRDQWSLVYSDAATMLGRNR